MVFNAAFPLFETDLFATSKWDFQILNKVLFAMRRAKVVEKFLVLGFFVFCFFVKLW